jgi:hypothetical protein
MIPRVTVTMDVHLTPGRAVQVRSVENGAMLVNLDTGICFELNRVGFEIWQLISDGMTPASICEVLSERYDVDRAALDVDVLRILDSLLKQRLVQPADQPTRPR